MENQQVNIDNLKAFVVCPLCGKEYRILTGSHVKSHKLSMSDFKKQFPDFVLESELATYNKSQAVSKAWKNGLKRENILNGLHSEEAKQKMSKKSLANWNNSELRTKRVQTMKDVANTPEAKEKFSQNSIKTWKNSECRESRIKGIRKATSTEEYKHKQSEHSKEMWKNPEHPNKVIEGYRNSDRKFIFTFKDGTVLYTRSSYEVKACGYMENLGIPFKYEVYRSDYYLSQDYPGYSKGFHSYWVDFYLPNDDIYLEVKPDGLVDYAVNQIKMQSVKDKGKAIYYITESQLKSQEAFKEFIKTVLTSTTIP